MPTARGSGRRWLGLGAMALGGLGLVWMARLGRGADPPNVVVVMWDTVRADRMSLYGYPVPTTPHLDALAADAVVYDRAMSAGMWTVPAHASLFTGLPASSHGAKVGWLWLDEHHETLAERLGDAGYATFAWSSNPYLSEATHLLQGFDERHFSWRGDDAVAAGAATRAKLLPEDRSVEISPAWVPSGNGEGWSGHLTAVKDAGPVIVDTFLGFVDGLDGSQPFLAYLNFLEAHHPRVPSMAARRAVASPERVDRSLRADLSLFRLMSAMEGIDPLSDDELDALSAVYDATLWDLDQALGDLVAGLEARGLSDDTVIVVVSDHGEHLGEGGMLDHRWSVDQELLHVPLVVRYPAALSPRRVPEVVSTRHLFGSLLALAGRPGPPTLDDGEPVVSELVAPTPRLPEVRHAHPEIDPDRWKRRYRVWFSGDDKYVRVDDGSQRLHDLTADRPDAVDHGPQRPGAVAAGRQGLSAWDEQRPPYRPALRGASDRPGRPMAPDAPLREQLLQLGYAVEAP